MKRPRESTQEAAVTHKKQALYVPPGIDTFSFLVEQQIFPLTYIIDVSDEYKQVIATFQNISETNKPLNAYLNNGTVVLNLIKQTSYTFRSSDQRVGRDLRIKIAKRIHNVQELLYAGIHEALANSVDTLDHLDFLIKDMGADINFTYHSLQRQSSTLYTNRATLLAITFQNKYRKKTKNKIIGWLLDNDAILEPITKNKDSAAALAFYHNNQSLLQKIFTHPQFNPHHADCNRDTLLHHCIRALQQRKGKGVITQTQIVNTTRLVEQLLIKGIDASIANTEGITALMMAENLGYLSIINSLKRYLSS